MTLRTNTLQTPPLKLAPVQGNSKGDCFVFDTTSGERLAHVSPVRISAPVRAAGLSVDGRHLLAAIGRGFVFRFEYGGDVSPQASQGPAEDDKDSAGSEGQQQQLAGA